MLMLMLVRVGMAMAVVVLVPVVPEFGLVQQEEEHQADQQRAEQPLGVGAALQGFRQQVHEGGREQGARGEAQEVLPGRPAVGGAGGGHQGAHAHQGGGEPDAADAGSQCREEDGE